MIVTGVVLGILGIIFYSSRQPEPKQETMMKKDSVKGNEGDRLIMSDQPRYFEYSKTAFDRVSDKRRVLYFYANWCPICRPADLNFKENVNIIPEDVAVVRVNYNDTDTDQEEKDLAQKYGITYQHTFVQIDAEGNKVTAWNGGSIDELLKNIN